MKMSPSGCKADAFFSFLDRLAGSFPGMVRWRHPLPSFPLDNGHRSSFLGRSHCYVPEGQSPLVVGDVARAIRPLFQNDFSGFGFIVALSMQMRGLNAAFGKVSMKDNVTGGSTMPAEPHACGCLP